MRRIVWTALFFFVLAVPAAAQTFEGCSPSGYCMTAVVTSSGSGFFVDYSWSEDFAQAVEDHYGRPVLHLRFYYDGLSDNKGDKDPYGSLNRMRTTYARQYSAAWAGRSIAPAVVAFTGDKGWWSIQISFTFPDDEPPAGGLEPAPAADCAASYGWHVRAKCFVSRKTQRVKNAWQDIQDAASRIKDYVTGGAHAQTYNDIIDNFKRSFCGWDTDNDLGFCGSGSNNFRAAATAIEDVYIHFTSSDPDVIDFVNKDSFDPPDITLNPAGGTVTLWVTFVGFDGPIAVVRADGIEIPATTVVPALPAAGLAVLAAVLAAAGLRRRAADGLIRATEFGRR